MACSIALSKLHGSCSICAPLTGTLEQALETGYLLSPSVDTVDAIFSICNLQSISQAGCRASADLPKFRTEFRSYEKDQDLNPTWPLALAGLRAEISSANCRADEVHALVITALRFCPRLSLKIERFLLSNTPWGIVIYAGKDRRHLHSDLEPPAILARRWRRR